MEFKVNVYRKVIAWDKTVYTVNANNKDEAADIAVSMIQDADNQFYADELEWELLHDTMRYKIDQWDLGDISYEIAIDGDMMRGGGKFCESTLQRAVEKLLR